MEEEEKQQQEHEQGGACESNSNPIHVLAVDDCFFDRKIVGKILEKASFKVTSVDSGKKALEVLGLNQDKVEKSTYNDQKINIILTDYCMPEMNGYDLLMAVKENSNVKSIPVVIISSEYDPQRISRFGPEEPRTPAVSLAASVLSESARGLQVQYRAEVRIE